MMVILEVFTKNFIISYKSTLLSKATLLTLLFGIVSVVLPFIVAYKTKGLWIKRDVLYEQPDVKFKGEYIFLATTNHLHKPIITCSTIPQHEKKFDLLQSCSMIRVRETDKNFDNKVDEFNLNLQVNLPKETHLTSFYIIIPLDYKLQRCPLQMQAALIYHTFLPMSVSKYVLMSDIVITQSSPLMCHTRKINSFYNYSVLMVDPEYLDNNDLNSVLREYSQRNVSTTLKNVYVSFAPGNTRNFILDVNVRYPETKIYYKPGFWQTIKWAWIQYLAIYLVVSWFVSKLKNYIFTKRLVLLYEDNTFKKKQ